MTGSIPACITSGEKAAHENGAHHRCGDEVFVRVQAGKRLAALGVVDTSV
jgi:hypothetical protein